MPGKGDDSPAFAPATAIERSPRPLPARGAHRCPADAYRCTAASLLCLWLLLGWLLPTLLVLPSRAAGHQPTQHGQQGSKLAAATARVDSWLRMLLLEAPHAASGMPPAAAELVAELGPRGGTSALFLRWLAVLVVAFQASCAVAQLYSAPP